MVGVDLGWGALVPNIKDILYFVPFIAPQTGVVGLNIKVNRYK